MPENFRALIVIFGLASVVFSFAKKAACDGASAREDFDRRRNLWFAITLTAFLAHDFWVFVVVTAIVLLAALRKEKNKLAMFFSLMFVVPQISGTVPGFGLIEFLFNIDIDRLLAIVMLLPASLTLAGSKDRLPFGKTLPDKLMAGYLVLQFFLMLQGTTGTNAIRHGIFYAVIDAFLPYYVASRLPTTLKEFRDVVAAFTVSAVILAAVATFEFAKHWMLYQSLSTSLTGADLWGWGYLARGESLRAAATTGQPIPLGYVITIAMGLLCYLRIVVPSSSIWRGALALLLSGLVATLSRGPWVGAIALVLVFFATGPSPGKDLFKVAAVGSIFTVLLLASPWGSKFVNLIPFVGNTEPQNVEYRQLFIQQSMLLIKQNPWFGSIYFSNAPEMQMLKPQGLLDTLNIFLTVALGSGLVGLCLFGGFFVVVAFGIFKGMRRFSDKSSEGYLLGRALFSSLVAIVVIINTISAITIIPLVYWCIAGLGVAYAQMVSRGNVNIEATKAGGGIIAKGYRGHRASPKSRNRLK